MRKLGLTSLLAGSLFLSGCSTPVNFASSTDISSAKVEKPKENIEGPYSFAPLNTMFNIPQDIRDVSLEESLLNTQKNIVDVIVKEEGYRTVGSGVLLTENGYVMTAKHVLGNVEKTKNETYIKHSN